MAEEIVYKEKELRKVIRETVADYKAKMLGRYSIVDIGGRKWTLEYQLLYWREQKDPNNKRDFTGWDYYTSGSRQRDIFWDMPQALKEYPADKLCVCIALMCNERENETKMFKLDGSKIEKYVEEV